MSTRLEDKTALVTGATRNIGRAMAALSRPKGRLLGAARYAPVGADVAVMSFRPSR